MIFRFLVPGIVCCFLFLNIPLSAQFSFITGPSLPTQEINFRRALSADASGGIWVGFNNSIGYYNGTNWRMYADTSGAPVSRVTQIEPVAGAVWFASADSGLAVLDSSGWTGYNTQNSGLTNDSVREISVDGNVLWIATPAGLVKFDGVAWSSYTTSNSGLLNNNLLSVSAFNGIVWMVSASGVNRFETSTQTWTAFPVSSLPVIGNLKNLLAIGNDVWLAGSAGVAYWNNGAFHSIKEITDGYDFPLSLIEKGRQGMPVFLSTAGPRYGVQLVNNQVPHRISTSPLNNTLGARYLIYLPLTDNFLYLSASVDMSPQPGTQILAVGDTDPGIDSHGDYGTNRYINLNDVNGVFTNRGDFGPDLQSVFKFEVPKNSGVNALIVSGLWIGGFDAGGQLHQAAMTYRQNGFDYFPGPLDTTNAAADSAVAAQYNYIWKINRTDVEAFIYHFAQGNVQNGSFIPAGDILSWPAQGSGNFSRNLAPFFDANNNGIYDPLTGGDYPVIKGDQMLYFIFNDNLAPHTETGGQPMGIEVHASVWAYACGNLPDSLQVLNTTVFYSYEIINRSSVAYSQVRAGLFQDWDLGSFSDDYVGSTPADNVCFVYNGLPNDGPPNPIAGAYGANPPVFGLTVLDGPDALPFDSLDNDNDGVIDEADEKNLLSHFQYFNNDFSLTGFPESAHHYYNYLNSYWKDGAPVTYGGNGYGGITPVSFMYSDVPFATGQWSEPAVGNIPNDRRGIASTNLDVLAPQTSATITYAQVWSRDTTAVHGTPGYINFFLNDVRRVQNWYVTNSFPSCVSWTVGVAGNQQQPLNAKLYPNPGNALVTLDYLPQTAHAKLEVLDIAGRVVQQIQLQPQPLNVMNAGELLPGVYLVRVVDGDNVLVFRFVRQ